MFDLKLEVKGLEKVQAQLRKLSQGQLNQANSKAINDAAFHARKGIQDAMARNFDRPTPYIMRSVRVVMASPEDLNAWIEPTYMGGKGIDPQKILKAQAFGGPRRDKRSEKLLRNAGLLPAGYMTAIPEKPYPGSDDGSGNLRGPFLVQLLSYFNAFGEQGYKANMSERRRQKIHNLVRTDKGYKTINGVVYFVSYGKLRGQHLAPGIWAKTGIHGVNVRPVVLFVRAPVYKPRLNMDEISREIGLQAKYESRLRYRIRQAVEELGL
jgi:hypothetical protein